MSWTIHHGDCREVMATLDAESVDAIVSDPPYGLSFMGKGWDHGVPGVEFWTEALRVAKPGAHLLAFGGTRTYHRLACAIEDAGWEIRDCVMWVYGSGFPKSLNVSKAVEKLGPQHDSLLPDEQRFCDWMRESSGLEALTVKRLTGSARFITGEVEIVNTATTENPRWGRRAMVPTAAAWEKLVAAMSLTPPEWVSALVKEPPSPPITHPGEWKSGKGEGTSGSNEWAGWGTALKPAWEPIIVARKPLVGTVAENVLTHGTGAINVDGCRVGTDAVTINTWDDGAKPFGGGAGHAYTGRTVQGRWPANLIHDGSEEVVGLFPETHGAGTFRHGENAIFGGCEGQPKQKQRPAIDSGGSTARFFYCAKASKADRDEGCEGLPSSRRQANSGNDRGPRVCCDCGKTDNGSNDHNKCQGGFRSHEALPQRNHHPTVKPTDLMRYLCRLVTPHGGVVLDPFMGSGSTGKAAILEGFRFIGIEREAEYVEIAKARIAAVSSHAGQLF